jgi:hypothetical protein
VRVHFFRYVRPQNTNAAEIIWKTSRAKPPVGAMAQNGQNGGWRFACWSPRYCPAAAAARALWRNMTECIFPRWSAPTRTRFPIRFTALRTGSSFATRRMRRSTSKTMRSLSPTATNTLSRQSQFRRTAILWSIAVRTLWMLRKRLPPRQLPRSPRTRRRRSRLPRRSLCTTAA